MRPSALALPAVAIALLLAAPNIRAEDGELDAAVAEFADAEKALSTSAPCDTMCKALQSMIRAADRICELARDGTATDQKRCTDAKTKVADATARVRASCPNCDPSPPYAPSTTPTPIPMPKPGDAAGTPKTAAPPPAEPSGSGSDAKEERVLAAEGLSARPTTTFALDVIPLFAPPWVVQARLERSIARRFSFTIVGAFGSLPKNGPEGAGRISVFGVGGEARAYLLGGFERFGLFVGADLVYRSASNLNRGEYVDARGYPSGLTAGALVGTKVVFAGGITVEARIGPALVVDDHRNAGPRDKVIPNGGVSLGWTF